MAAKSRKRRRSLLIGAGALAVIAFITYVAAVAPLGLPWAPHTTVKAAFGNVGNLKAGDDVRENSVQIGTVTGVDIENGRAVATLRLDGDVPVHSDARAAIWDESALAKHFVELDRGHDGAGALGDRTIPGRRNLGATDLDNLLSVFDPTTRQKLTSAVRELGGGAAGHSADLHAALEHAPSLLNGGGDITAALSSQRAHLPELLDSAKQLAGAFNGHERQVSALVPQLDSTLRGLNVDGGVPLRTAVADLPGTLRNVRAGLLDLNQPLADTRQAVTTLRPGVDALGQATPDLRGVLREGIRPLDRVPGVARQANPAVEGLTRISAVARPLAPRLSEGLMHANPPLQVLAPYSMEIRSFFDRLNSLVSTSTGPGRHVARLGLALEGLSTAGGGVIKDPLLPRHAYPAPGQADRDRSASPLIPVTGGFS